MSIETESHEFIGWYEGYHGRDGEIAELRDEIERLTAELDTMNNVHKHLATELADMGRERDRLDKQLIGWMNAFAEMSIERDELKTLSDAWLGDLQKARAERDRLRAALQEIIVTYTAVDKAGYVARRALAGGTRE